MKASPLSRGLSLVLLTLSPISAGAADYFKEVLADNPLVYYQLNDATPADIALNSGSAYYLADGVYSNTVTHRVPGALSGDGSSAAGYVGDGGRIAVPFNPLLNPPASSPFTIEAWVKPTIEGLGNAQCPLFNRHSTGNRQGWVFFQRLSTEGFNFRMYNQNGSTQSVDLTGGTYTVGEWCHLVAVWDGTMATLYVNGVGVASQAASYVANSDAPLSIGAYGADAPGNNAFTGSVDEVAFYASALDSAAVKIHHAVGINPHPTILYSELVAINAPILYLHLDEPAPGADIAANNGSLGSNGDALRFPGQKHQIQSPLVGSLDWATGFTAIDPVSCDGGVPTHVAFKPELNTAVFSVEAWLQPTINGTGNAQCPLYNRKEGDVRTGWAFFQRDSATGWNFRMYNGVNADRCIDITGGPYTVGNWVHLVATFDGAIGSLYVNGVLAGTQPVSGSYAPNADSVEFSVGGFSNGIENPFTGGIDEVALYPSALNAQQVLAHYQSTIPATRIFPYEFFVPSDGAVEYLRLNDPARLTAANLGSLGAGADATYVNVVNTAAGPQATDFKGFESNNTAPLFGGNSYVELGNPPGLNFAGTISVEAWIIPADSQPADARIVSHGANDTNTAEVSLRIANGNYEFGSLTARATSSAAADILAAAPVYLVGTYDGVHWNLFRNGVLLASAPDAAGATTIDNANWAIGARGRWKTAAGYPASGQEGVFNGVIDEVAIYRQALSPARISAHYITAVAEMEPLQITRTGAATTLTWPRGILQASDDLAGFTDVAGAVSPYAVPAGVAKKYYRLRF